MQLKIFKGFEEFAKAFDEEEANDVSARIPELLDQNVLYIHAGPNLHFYGHLPGFPEL